MELSSLKECQVVQVVILVRLDTQRLGLRAHQPKKQSKSRIFLACDPECDQKALSAEWEPAKCECHRPSQNTTYTYTHIYLYMYFIYGYKHLYILYLYTHSHATPCLLSYVRRVSDWADPASYADQLSGNEQGEPTNCRPPIASVRVVTKTWHALNASPACHCVLDYCCADSGDLLRKTTYMYKHHITCEVWA